MSIGFLKRLLTSLNIVAVLTIVYAGWGFWEHRSSMENGWRPEVFTTTVEPPDAGALRIKEIGIPLGRFPKQVEDTGPVEPVETKVEQIQSVIARLGKIKTAVVAYEPYRTNKPAIVFELNQPRPDGSKTLTLGLGEAIENRVDPEVGPLFPIPVRYKFVGCEPDPGNATWTSFLFDMNCDGKDIQRLPWKGEQEVAAGSPVVGEGGPAPEAGATIRSDKVFVGRGDPAAIATKPVAAPESPRTGPEPAQPQPPPAPGTDFTGPIFESDGDTFVPSRASSEYLKNNHQRLIKDAETRTYVDPRTRRASGIRIVRLRPGSQVNAFGIREDDVILAINDRAVSKRAQAINIVKDELKKPNVHIIQVKILRDGQERVLRFDTRDRETRRRAGSLRGLR